MMVTEIQQQSKRFRKVVSRQIVIGFVLAMCIGFAIVTIVPGVYYDAIQVEDGPPITGSPEVTISQTPSDAVLEVDLFRTSDFTLESGWYFDEFTTQSDSIVWYDNSTNGIQITGTNSDFRMYRFLNVLVDDFDAVFFSCMIQSVNGPMTCGIRITCEEGLYWIIDFEDEVDWDEGRTGIYNYSLPMNIIKSYTSHWSLNIKFEIRIQFPDNGIAKIYDARAHGVASTPVIPTTFDFRSLEGKSFFGTVEGRSLLYPFMQVTANSDNGVSFLMVFSLNETIFLPVDNYTIEYGWYQPIEIRNLNSFNLSTTSTARSFVSIPMNVTRLDIECNIQSPLQIEFYSETLLFDTPGFFGRIEFFPSYSSYVYLPCELGPIRLEIQLRYFPHYSYTSETIEIGTSNHVKLVTHFPIFNFLGYGLDAVQLLIILILVGLSFALLVSLTHATTPIPLSKLLKKEHMPSLILLLLSFILPWGVRVSFPISHIGQWTQLWSSYPAIGLTSLTTIPGLTFLNFFQMQPSWIIWAIGFFWIPLFFILRQIILSKPMQLDLATIIPPVIPGFLGFMTIILPTTSIPGVGAYLAILALLVTILQATYKSRYVEG